MTAVTDRPPLAASAAYLLESIPHIVWTASADGQMIYVNATGEDYTGRVAHGHASEPLTWWLHEDDVDHVRTEWLRSVTSGADYCVECRVRRRDGHYRWHAVRARPMQAPGMGDLWLGTAVDIDDQKRVEATLRLSEREADETLTLLEAIDASTPVGLKVVDRDFRIVRVNRRMAQLNGRSVAEHVGRTVADISPAIWAEVEGQYQQALNGTPIWNRPMTLPAAPHRPRPAHFLTSYFPVRVKGEVIGVGNIVVDVTEQFEADQFRAVVMDTMAEGLFTLDPDGRITYVNDAAQKMLGWTAEELYGRSSHEFIHFQRADGTQIPADQCELNEVRLLGRTVRTENETYTRKDGSIFSAAMSASPLRVGNSVHGTVVVFRDNTEEKSERAAMQRELNALSWIGRVRDALDEQRLELHAQPIVPLREGGVHSEELLLRMRTPSGDLVRPGSFLPVAEKYGLIVEIDRWVIQQAAERAAATRSTVEVNISAKSIATVELLPYIRQQLAETGADPAHLVFEVTETELMSDMAAGEMFAQRIADLGCGLALDDFGTGYGSFTYLKRLPATHLKIDTEFVRELPANSANRHVVSAIVDLGRAFGMCTVAEGVEDGETLEALREIGVDYAQGYFVGYPEPID